MNYRIAICGSGGVGKSCITIKYIQNMFIDDYDPTIEDMYRKQVTIDNETCLLDVLDTAGQEEYVSMRDSYMRTAEGFILVFSINSKLSLYETDSFYSHLLKCKDTNKIPLILVGNKCDLQREVSTSEGKAVAHEYNAIYIECSAKNGFNIDEVFVQLVRKMKEFRKTKSIITKKKKCVII